MPAPAGGLRQAAVAWEKHNHEHDHREEQGGGFLTRNRRGSSASSEPSSGYARGRRGSQRSLPASEKGFNGRGNQPAGKFVRHQHMEHTDFGVQIGEFLARFKMKVLSRLHGKKQGLREQEVDTLAAIIRMYRGVQDDDEPDSTRVLPDRGWFEIMMGVVSLANMAILGLELEHEGKATSDRAIEWIVAEALFCTAYVGEVVLKFAYHGWRWIFFDWPNLFIVLIALSVLLDCAVFHPLGIYSHLRLFSLFRVIGLIGLRKTFARLHIMEELSGVLEGLWTTASAIFWVVVLCFFFLYMCSVFVTEQVGRNLDYVNYRKISGGWDAEELFGTIGRSMLTLLQMMTLDSWSSQIARHVINSRWEIGAFFIIFLVLSTYGLLNIVVSVIVEHMLQAAAKNDRKAKARLDSTRKSELDSIKEVFVLSDKDGSGEVDLMEFLEAVKNPEVQWRMKQLGLPITGAAKLFAVIDGDGSRTLTITEFINGCKKLKGTAQSKDLLVIQAQADILTTKMEGLARSLEDSERMMSILDSITVRTERRFSGALEGARKNEVSNASGTMTITPLKKTKKEGNMAVGNYPTLPTFPNLLR